MEPKEKVLPLINWPAARRFIVYPFLALLGCALVYNWVVYTFPALIEIRKSVRNPLRAEAKTLALTYE